MEEVFTLVEAAQRLKVSVRTLRRLVLAGTVRGFQVGRQWRLQERDLQLYIDRQRNHAQQGRGGRSRGVTDIRHLEGWDTFR